MNFIKKIPLAIKFIFDGDVPFRKKIWLILTLLYVFSPLDLIPDPVLGFGIVDDITIAALILSKLSSDLENYKLELEKRNKDKDIKDKIIEDVQYEIHDEDE